MKDHYPSEKFSAAVGTLAASPRPLQGRIADAFVYSLDRLIGNPAVPEDVKEKLAEYNAAWRAVEDAGEQGTISVWASGLSDDEAMDIATWIVDKAFELDRQYWSDEG